MVKILVNNTDIYGSKYCLDAFHIHWGVEDNTGSEHRINGKQSVMEMHFVHYKCPTYKKVSEAMGITIPNDDKADPTLAVVSVLFEIGQDENVLIQKIVDQIQGLKLKTVGAGITISDTDFFDVVPMDDDEIEGSYYHYKGSLTTPPCTPVGKLTLHLYI